MKDTPPSWYYADASNQPVGPVTAEQLQSLLQGGTIALDTLVIQEGGTEWQPLKSIISLTPPATPPLPQPQKEVQTNVKQGALIGGVACFALGIWLMHVSLWSFFFYGPLFVVSFILSIVAMSQRRVVGGILLLLSTLVVPAVLGFCSFQEGVSSFLTGSRPAPAASPDLTTTKQLTTPRGSAANEPSPTTTPTPEPAQPEHPKLQEKNGTEDINQPDQIADEDAFKENVQQSKTKAIALYPDLAVAGSALNTEFVARLNCYRIEKKEFFEKPDWPLRLAKEITDAGTPSAASAKVQDARRLESRFSTWTQELARKKKAQLYAPTEILQRGGTSKDLRDFETKSAEIIKQYEAKLLALRKLIAELDQSGASFERTQKLIDAVYSNEVFVGMPAAFAYLSWGKPTTINRTTFGRTQTEQWVYRHEDYTANYLNLEDGVISSIQN